MSKLICCFLLTAIALFADVTGKWTGTGSAASSDGDNQTLAVTLDLKQTGKEVTGTVTNGDSGEQYTIKNGTVDGDTLKMDVLTGETTYGVTLTIKEDQMTGEAVGDNGGAKVTVKLNFKRQS